MSWRSKIGHKFFGLPPWRSDVNIHPYLTMSRFCVCFDQYAVMEMMMKQFLFPGLKRLAAYLLNYSLLELNCLVVRSLKHMEILCV